MNRDFVPSPIDLPRGKVLRIEGGRGTLVQVWEGEVWLTQDRSPEDHVLRPGQWFRLDKEGLALACPLSRAVISISAPRREEGALRRFWRQLRERPAYG